MATLSQAEMFRGLGFMKIQNQRKVLSTVFPRKVHLHRMITDLKGKEEKKYITRNKTQTKAKKALGRSHPRKRRSTGGRQRGRAPRNTVSLSPVRTPALHSMTMDPTRTEIRVRSAGPTWGLAHSRSVNMCKMDERSSKKKKFFFPRQRRSKIQSLYFMKQGPP